MESKLQQAVDIYRSLGYEEASMDGIMKLGLGSSEEQRIAREGLKSGEWTQIRQLSENSYGFVKVEEVADVDLEKLAIFAVRVGVDAKRAANVLRVQGESALSAIASRGEKYASDFIAAACRSDRRIWEHSASAFGLLCVNLVLRMGMTVPQSVEYIKDWSVYAGNAMGILEPDRRYDKSFVPGMEELRRSFVEHIEEGVAINAPATGPFSEVLAEGVKQGLLSEEKARTLVFFALDRSIRPGDRKAWVSVLDRIGLTKEDILSRTESLIPLLALGESAIIERFAPVLIEHSSDEHLPGILISVSSSKVKKIRLMMLRCALGRVKPSSVNEISEWIALWAQDEDRSLAKAAQKLAKAWEIVLNPSESQVKTEEIRGLWQKTPGLWTVPAFDIDDCSPMRLTELAAQISVRREDVADLVTETFLAMANRIAYQNPEEARLSLAGMRSGTTLTNLAGAWAKGKEIPIEIDRYQKRWENGVEMIGKKTYAGLIYARNIVVLANIDKPPCLLSTPSRKDLSILLSDLADRLSRYQEEWMQKGFKAGGTAPSGTKEENMPFVWEPDLQLALTRLDLHSATPKMLQKLSGIDLFVRMPDGEIIRDEKGIPILAGELIRNYIRDPYAEPEFNEGTPYWRVDIERPESLRHLPNRLEYSSDSLFSIFPLWGDFALTAVRRDTEVYHSQGKVLRQVARRSKPLTAGALMNLLAAQSYLSAENAEDVIAATKKAWERGLMIPGSADVRYLDWRGGEPSNLASLAESLDHIAQDGILSVVWQVVDDLIDESLKAPRMFSGTAQLVKLIEKYLDEVLFAVERGTASAEALKLRGLRKLAKKTGTSLAVTTAKSVTAKLGDPDLSEKSNDDARDMARDERQTQTKLTRKTSVELPESAGIPVPEIPFAKVWQIPETEKPIIEDGVSMRIEQLKTKSSVKPFLFRLRLPDVSEYEYQVIINTWLYGLSSEGQTRAIEAPPNSPYMPERKANVWLYWDASEKRIKVSLLRNRRGNTDGPLEGEPSPLSVSLLTIIVGLLAQDGDTIYSARSYVQNLVQSGELGIGMLRRVTGTLLSNEAVSPVKLVRVLEKDAQLLPVFWVMLTECIRVAGEKTDSEGRPPVWVNRVLDICLYHAHYLKEAMQRGLIPPDDAKWVGLDRIAECKTKSAAVQKAKMLSAFLHVSNHQNSGN